MLKEILNLSNKFNSIMNDENQFILHSNYLINEYTKIADKYPSEILPLTLLKTIICKSKSNQTRHIEILNKIIEINDSDSWKEDLVNCKNQPCNECKIWDNVKKDNFSLQSNNINKPLK